MTDAMEPEDEIIKQLADLQKEGKGALLSFQKRVASKAFADANDLAGEVKDLFALFLDLAALTTSAHTEQFDWASGVDDEIDAIRAGLPPGSALVPTDAENLAQLIKALRDNLRAPASDAADQQRIAELQSRASEALEFIEQITAEPEDDEDDEDEEPEADPN